MHSCVMYDNCNSLHGALSTDHALNIIMLTIYVVSEF